MNLMREQWVEIFMKNVENSAKTTVVLNKYASDGFLDFYYSSDLEEVMKVLSKVMKGN